MSPIFGWLIRTRLCMCNCASRGGVPADIASVHLKRLKKSVTTAPSSVSIASTIDDLTATFQVQV